jgi:hypothetical protein
MSRHILEHELGRRAAKRFTIPKVGHLSSIRNPKSDASGDIVGIKHGDKFPTW